MNRRLFDTAMVMAELKIAAVMQKFLKDFAQPLAEAQNGVQPLPVEEDGLEPDGQEPPELP